LTSWRWTVCCLYLWLTACRERPFTLNALQRRGWVGPPSTITDIITRDVLRRGRIPSNFASKTRWKETSFQLFTQTYWKLALVPYIKFFMILWVLAIASEVWNKSPLRDYKFICLPRLNSVLGRTEKDTNRSWVKSANEYRVHSAARHFLVLYAPDLTSLACSSTSTWDWVNFSDHKNTDFELFCRCTHKIQHFFPAVQILTTAKQTLVFWLAFHCRNQQICPQYFPCRGFSLVTSYRRTAISACLRGRMTTTERHRRSKQMLSEMVHIPPYSLLQNWIASCHPVYIY